MSSHDQLDDGDLGRLLEQAHWPVAQPEQLTRLEANWRMLARRRRMRRATIAMALAASVLIACGTVFIIQRQPRSVEKPRREVAQTTASDTISIKPAPGPQSSEVASRESTDRPSRAIRYTPVVAGDLTLRERVLLAEEFRRPPPPDSQKSSKVTQDAQPNPLNQLIEALAQDSNADVAAQINEAREAVPDIEKVVFTATTSGAPARRRGAARLFSRIATRRSLEALNVLRSDPVTRDPAIDALCRLATPEELAALVRVERAAESRERLLSALLASNERGALEIFLSLVNDPSMRRSALMAAAKTLNPPVDALVQFLDHPDWSLRTASALTLGAFRGVDVAEPLAHAALKGRQEAFVALLMTTDLRAAEFLKAAVSDERLSALVNSAKQQLLSLTL